MRRASLVIASVAFLGVATGCSDPGHVIQALQFEDRALSVQLGPLARSIGDSRIVLLGENGHGVGSLSELKVGLIEWLYQALGFEVLVFESGFFECGHVWRRIDSLEPGDALLLQHGAGVQLRMPWNGARSSILLSGSLPHTPGGLTC